MVVRDVEEGQEMTCYGNRVSYVPQVHAALLHS